MRRTPAILHHRLVMITKVSPALAVGGEQPWKSHSNKYWIRKSMRRPGLNKNEGIRINIEQRYFLEDRFSKQGKLKVCKERPTERKNIVLFHIVFWGLLSPVCNPVHLQSFVTISTTLHGKGTPSTVWFAWVCVSVIMLIVCLPLRCDNRM